MNNFLRVNLYEIQALLLFILGEIILNFGTFHWVGWVCIAYGWLIILGIIAITARHADEMKEFFNEK